MAKENLIVPEIPLFKFSELTKKAFVTDPFPPEAAAEIGSSALQADKEIRDLVERFFGGTFDACHFKIKPGMGAVRLWYCYNKNGGRLPEFFLALEQIPKFNEKNPEEITGPSDSTYVVPEIFPYGGISSSKADVLDFFTNNRATTTPESNRVIDQTALLGYVKDFKTLMNDVLVSTQLLYCKYSVAVFDFNGSYNNFMLNNPIKIKYFIGFANNAIHTPNYLRPILAGVDSNGGTMTSTFAGQAAFLQKSVPPPPPQ